MVAVVQVHRFGQVDDFFHQAHSGRALATDVVGHFQRGRQHLVPGDHLLNDAEALKIGGVDPPSGQRHPAHDFLGNDAGQMLRPAHHAHGDLRQPEGRGVGCNHNVALRHHHQAATQRVAVDGRDHGDRIAPDGVENLAHDACSLQRQFRVHRAEFRDVATRDKRAVARAGQHDTTDIGIVFDRAQRVAQFAVCRDRHRIDGRQIDRDQQDIGMAFRS